MRAWDAVTTVTSALPKPKQTGYGKKIFGINVRTILRLT
jgi:hypothetical protein